MSKRKSGLGPRGLGALIPGSDSPEEAGAKGVRLVPIGAIEPNPHQPRTLMDEAKLAELAASIAQHGLIQPLIVTEENGRYILIAGERRWRASKQAGHSEVPVIVKEATPQAMLELALIENIQRADLNALEEAMAYQQLMAEFGLTQADVAERVGKARSTIANLVRILELPEAVQQAILNEQISGRHARELLRLPAAEQQIMAANQIIRLGLSARQTTALVDNLLAEAKPRPPAPKRKLAPELADLVTQFEQSLGTRVNIEPGGKRGEGKVIIYYYSDEELDAIYQVVVEKS
jgi:ParB family transcriptional regulator, chromosome partitioning protein